MAKRNTHSALTFSPEPVPAKIREIRHNKHPSEEVFCREEVEVHR
jgi:hypothetical protein